MRVKGSRLAVTHLALEGPNRTVTWRPAGVAGPVFEVLALSAWEVTPRRSGTTAGLPYTRSRRRVPRLPHLDTLDRGLMADGVTDLTGPDRT